MAETEQNPAIQSADAHELQDVQAFLAHIEQCFQNGMEQSGPEHSVVKINLADPAQVDALVAQFFALLQAQMKTRPANDAERAVSVGLMERLAEAYAGIFSGQVPGYVPAPHWEGKTLAAVFDGAGGDALAALKEWFCTDIAAQYIASTAHHQSGHMTEAQYQGFVNELKTRMQRELLGPDKAQAAS